MPGSSDDLRILLKGFNGQTGCRISAFVTRSGAIVASALPGDVAADNFATMAATLLGALEVIFTAAKGPAPQSVTVQTAQGTLFVRSVTSRVFFVALTDGESAEAGGYAEEIATRARAVLAKTT